jgi:hypothetical protein
MRPDQAFRFRARQDDPGERWADEVLAPLRRRAAEVDVTGAVMRRIEARRPAPAPPPLPARWAGASWAATLALGFAGLGLLLATAAVMAFGSDQEARSLLTVLQSAGRLASHGYAHAGSLAAGLGQAAFAVFKGAWLLVATAAPLVRGAGLLAAAGGLLSIVISIVVVSRARLAAPVADRRGYIRMNGGLS